MSSLGVRSLGMCSPINYFVTADAQISIFGGRSSLYPGVIFCCRGRIQRASLHEAHDTRVSRAIIALLLMSKCEARNGRARLCLTKQAREE